MFDALLVCCMFLRENKTTNMQTNVQRTHSIFLFCSCCSNDFLVGVAIGEIQDTRKNENDEEKTGEERATERL